MRGSIGVFCAALVSGGAIVASPVAMAAGTPLTWSGPVRIDDQPPFGNPNLLSSVSCPSVSLCVAVDYEGDAVTSTDPTGGAADWTVTQVDGLSLLLGVSCPSVSLCVAVDQAGDVVTSTNPTGGAADWTVTQMDGAYDLDGVSCPSVSLCVAVDDLGDVVTSTDPTGGASAWSVTDADGAYDLDGVSCPSSSLCVAVDDLGDVVTSTNPTGGAGAWTVTNVDGSNFLDGVACPSSSLCVALSAGNMATSTDPTGGAGAWTVTAVDGTNYLDGVSCPSSSLCVAVDSSGNVITSTNPTGGAGAWTVTDVDGSHFLDGVSCPSSGLCVAVDAAGDVVISTDPTGGAAAWTVTHVDGINALSGVSCPSSGLCVAVDGSGNVVASADPTAATPTWTVTDVDGSPFLEGVSCPSSGLCVAVDGSGNVVTSTNPTGGAGAWSVTDVDGTNFMDGVSCPSSGLCVAVDQSGDAVTSTNPTGGAEAWTVADVDGTNYLDGVSCPSASLCAAVDQSGDAVTSTNPTGGAEAWTVADVDVTSYLDGVSCPSDAACVAVDSSGDAVTGTISGSLQDLPSTQQYFIHGSDGSTWKAMDTTLLADTFTPASTGTAVLSANADLWTENAGFNQDIGICLVTGAVAPSTCPTADLLAWKESGGFAGTFSPNAAYVQATAAVTSGTTYTAFVAWKANKAMPAGDTIAAGAGTNPDFSPARLTVTLPDASNAVSGASSTLQYAMNGSDGSTWKYVDTTNLALTLTPASSVDTVLSANADLWTEDAGYNQDIGICVAAGASLPTGSCPSSDVVIWKESGGFAGTYSPNAAFAQTVVAMSAGTYSVGLVWKANKPMPGTDTIVIGAGSGPYSPTRLVALQYPASGGVAFASSAQQYLMSGGSDGATWKTIDATNLTLTVPQASGCQLAVGGNADLWTDAAGFNQDIGIQVTPTGGTPYVAAWKESGGFAGTFSPNAAFVEAVIPISAASSYSITLVWKTNKAMPASHYIAVGAGSIGAYSPTTLTATEHC
jgi:hypothetical protein